MPRSKNYTHRCTLQFKRQFQLTYLALLGAGLVLTASVLPGIAVAQSYEYTYLLPEGWESAQAYDINDTGEVVGSGIHEGVPKGFLYSGGNYFEIKPPDWSSAYAYGINSNGEVVGYGDHNGITKGFLYSVGEYTEIISSTWSSAHAYDINDAGEVVGQCLVGGTQKGFVYSDGQYTELLPDGWPTAFAREINNSGAVAGGVWSSTAQTHEGFVYSAGEYVSVKPEAFGGSPVRSAYGRGINNQGDVVGDCWGDGWTHGYIYSGGLYAELLPPDWGEAHAWDVNNSGVVVGMGTEGGNTGISGIDKGFVYSDGQYTDLLPEGWSSAYAYRINNSGVIVGGGYDPSLEITRGFVATPSEPPTPPQPPPTPEYAIAYAHVQHRVYEDGGDFNRLGFAVRSLTGEAPADNVVMQVELYDPDGQEVLSVSNPGCSFYKTMNGSYDEATGGWQYPPEFQDENYYGFNFDASLIQGAYHLRVTDKNGAICDNYYTFNGLVALPIISADTFETSFEGSDFVLRWDVPDLTDIIPPEATSVRGALRIYSGEAYVGEVSVRVPTDLGYLAVPPYILEMIQTLGDRFELVVQLRTNDNNNRTYSNQMAPSQYYVGNWFVQSRRYEDGTDSNALMVQFCDYFHNRVSQSDVEMSEILLYDAADTEVPLSNIRTWSWNVAYGRYDGEVGYYEDAFHYEDGVFADIDEQLNPGIYRLVVTDGLGEIPTGYYQFNTHVDLPVISAATFETGFEGSQFVLRWEAPDLNGLNPIPDTSIRATLKVFDGEAYVGEHSVRVPAAVDHLSISTTYFATGNRLKLQLQLRTNDNNNRTYSKMTTISICDEDADGISDDLDETPTEYSSDFSDGTTSGTILDWGDQVLCITDASNPADGVVIAASGGQTPASVSVCGGATQYSLGDGDEIVVTCGSVISQVLSGTVKVTLNATDGQVATTTLNGGNGLVFDPVTFTITAPEWNQETVVIVVDGADIVLEPGGVNQMTVLIDIKPGSEPNCINNDGNGVIPVAILGSPDFDVSSIDPGSAQLEGNEVRAVGKSQKLLAHIEDVDGDGYDDLVVQIQDTDNTFKEGSTTAKLTGLLYDDTPIVGVDAICIVP